jgi:hypothetical protein
MRFYSILVFFVLSISGFSQIVKVRLAEKGDTLPVSRMMSYIMDPVDSSFLGFTDRDSAGIYSFELTHQPKGNLLVFLAFGHGYKPLTASIHYYPLENNIQFECERDQINVGKAYINSTRTISFEPNMLLTNLTGDYANRYFDTSVFYINKREQEIADSILTAYSGSDTLITLFIVGKPFTIPSLRNVEIIGAMDYFFNFFKDDVLFQHFLKINGTITMKFTTLATTSSMMLTLEFLDCKKVKIESLTSLSNSIINKRIQWVIQNFSAKPISSLPMEFTIEIIYLR